MRSLGWALKSVFRGELYYRNFFFVTLAVVGLFVLLLFSVAAYAQFGGKSGAPSGSVVGGGYDALSADTAVSDRTGSESSSSSFGSSSKTTASNIEEKLDSGALGYTANPNLVANGESALFNQRQRYFIRKLRLEFVARETIERETGIVASWTRVGFYLRDLDDELTFVENLGKAPNGVFIAGMARDLNLVEATLDDHIDLVLSPFEKGFLKPSSHVSLSPLPKSFGGQREKMRALAEKSELVDFATKALQAMGRGSAN